MQVYPLRSAPILTKIVLGVCSISAALTVAYAIFENYQHNRHFSQTLRERGIDLINKHCGKRFSFDQCFDKKENGFRFIDCIGKENPSYRFQYFFPESFQEQKVVCTEADIPSSYEERHIYFNKFSQEEIKKWEQENERFSRERFWEQEEHRQRWES